MEFKKKKRFRENKNKSNNDTMELYGFYYDKEKNRYFPINQDMKNNFFKKEAKKENKIIKKETNNKSIYSPYTMISRYSKIIDNRVLYYSFPKGKERIKQYNIGTLGEKVTNLPYGIMDKRYIVTMSNNSSMSVLTFTKISTDNYIKKIFFDNTITKYDNFTITEDNTLIIIYNFTLHFIIQPSILNWLDNKKSNVTFLLSSSIKLHINKMSNIPMMYTWPVISSNDQKFYILIWKTFYIISIDKVNKVKKKNTETIIIDQFTTSNDSYSIIYKKTYTKDSFINVYVNDKSVLLFESKGNIYKYSKRSMKLKQIISNESVSSIVDIVRYSKQMILFICDDRTMFSYNINNNNITMLYQSGSKNNLIFKRNLININGEFAFFKNENNKVCAYSLTEYEIMKEYDLKENEYNYIYNNNTNNIILLL